VLEREGFARYSPYAMVHNIGHLECESPWMAADKEYPIVEGMTVCIDVFFFRLPWGSFRIEDTVAVTARGADRLTTFNQSFVPKHFA
jgi:Xaa-Pro aminopeptidase